MIRSTSRWHVTGASVAGSRHRMTGHICDDAHIYRIHANDLLLIAVADGAGSAQHAATGAALAVQAAIARAEQLLLLQDEPAEHAQWLALLTDILTSAHIGLVEYAALSPSVFPLQQEESLPVRELATTLLLAIVTADWLAVAQIGDGAVVIQSADASYASLTPPREQQYLNETDFLTQSTYLKQAIFHILPRADIRGIALLTDGLELLAMNFPAGTPYQPFFASLFKFASQPDSSEEELELFLASDRVCEHTDDDKTLVLAVYQ